MSSAHPDSPVRIHTAAGHEQRIRWILDGLEEEGVPATVTQTDGYCVEDLSAGAADKAAFHVGFGVAENGSVHLRHARLPAAHLGDPLPPDADSSSLRRLGQNAGRIVKRLPLTIASGASWPQPVMMRRRTSEKGRHG